MGMQVGSNKGLVAAINVTPMVDVMLVLLIIFMVVTPFLQQGVTVVLPKGPHGEEDQDINKESAVIVAVPSDGIYYLGREAVTLDTMQSRIEKMIEKKTIGERVVYVKGDNRVHYREIVAVIDAIRGAGIDRVGLIVDPGKKGEGSQP
ncbi:MAG: biopolymer transporter ExbD [Acidobacteria bacterium]|nr:biopolymer transporter ExbD [Acidobacteriota bacterium]